MIFEINNTNKKVQEGYAIAGEILASGELLDRLDNVVKFTYTNQTRDEVISAFSAQVEGIVSGLTPKIPVFQEYINDSAIARVYSDRIGIYVNDKFTRSSKLSTYIRNGAHESTHVFGFKHGTNWLPTSFRGRAMMKVFLEFADKNQSVPLVIERLVYEIAKDKKRI